MQNRSGGTCNWPHTRGARLIEVAATAGGTVNPKFQASSHPVWLYRPVCV